MKRKGQAMILTILALGGTVVGATAIAGLLMTYQIRQSTDMGNSAKAIFAADTGVEWGLYQLFNPQTSLPGPGLSDPGVSYVLNCYENAQSVATTSCKSASTTIMRSLGVSRGVSRAFELDLTP